MRQEFLLRLRLSIWAAAALLILSGHLIWMFLLRGPRIVERDRIVIGGQLVLGGCLLVVMWMLQSTPPDAIRLKRRRSLAIIMAGAILLNGAAVLLLRPALSEDLLRYRMDGRMWASGTSPYATPPADWNGQDDIDAMAPYQQMATIYPPASEAVFAAVAGLEKGWSNSNEPDWHVFGEPSPWRAHLASRRHVYSASLFRLAFALVSVACTWRLILLLGGMDRSPWWAILFAWNPLMVLEVGGMGHQDVIGVFFILLAFYWLERKRNLGSAAALALAAAVKPFALLLVPFVARRAGGRFVLIFAVLLAAICFPALIYQRGYTGWRETARTYSRTWEANGSMYETVKIAFGAGDDGRAMARAKEMARLLAASIMLTAALIAWRLRASPADAGYWLCLLALLVSPVAYPWYLAWVLCFVPLLRSSSGWTAIVWSATASVSYLVWLQPQWRLSGALMFAEYGPVYAAMVIELVQMHRRDARASRVTAPPLPSSPVACPRT